MKKEPILILAGDKRQQYIYSVLSDDGYECEYENENADRIKKSLSQYRYIILPMPASKGGKLIYSNNPDFILSCEDLAERLSEKQIVFAGGLSKELIYIFERKNIVYFDLTKNEDFLTYNAFLTAQGAIRLLLENTEQLITGKNALITGFGRVGKALASAIKGLNLSVTVCVRNEGQKNLADNLGLHTIGYNSLGDILTETDYIFNTVPQIVFNTEHINYMKNDTLYFELASSPYGADRTEINKKLKFVDGSALPGKFVPYSAGEKIAKTIKKLI